MLQPDRRAEQVEVIRHQHITADKPGRRLPPTAEQAAMSLFGIENRFPIFGANGYENNVRTIP